MEVLVVDNGSTDQSQEIARTHADQLLVEPTATIAGLRNRGATQATNEIVVFVDSDCLLDPEWLGRCATHFENEKVAMAGAKTHTLPEDATWVAKAWKVHLDRSDLDPNPSWIVTRALAVRKDVFESVGRFDESLETCEDVALGHAISETYSIVADTALAPMHLDDADTLGELFSKERWRGNDSLLTSMRFITKHPQSLCSKEGISLALPFYFLSALGLLLIGALEALRSGSALLFFAGVGMVLLPLLFMSWDTCRKTDQWKWFCSLVVVYGVYSGARVAALFSGRRPTRSTPHA